MGGGLSGTAQQAGDGGIPGSITLGTGLASYGNAGAPGTTTAGGFSTGGEGGAGLFGAGKATAGAQPLVDIPLNTGSGAGGPGGGSGIFGGNGGGAGAVHDFMVNNPTSYAYTVGVGGTPGAAGTGGLPGVKGSDGIIIVDEFY
jgi:hypothetical protein